MQGFSYQQQGISGKTQVRLGGVHSPNLRVLAPREQDPPDMTLRVLGTGRVWVGHTAVDFADADTPVLIAPGAQDRIALLSVDSAGNLAWTYGVEAAVPAAPAAPYDAVVICAVYARPAMTAITDEDNSIDGYVLEDYRPFLYVAPVWCTFITQNDETAELPNSFRAVGGAGITVSYAAHVQTIEWNGLTVRRNSAVVGTRRQVNFIQGSGITIAAVDDGTEIDITFSNSSPGVTDHGALTGLLDDDHPQYLNTARHLAIGNSSPHHTPASVYAAPLTLAGQQIRFHYDTSDFGVAGNNLYIKDSGIDHGGLTGLGDDDHPQYLNTARHLAIGNSSPHHAPATVYAAPLTLAGQQIRFNYNTSDFELSGNDLRWRGVNVRRESGTIYQRRRIAVHEGTGISIVIGDDGTEIDLTFAATGLHTRLHGISINGLDHYSQNLTLDSGHYIRTRGAQIAVRDSGDTAYLAYFSSAGALYAQYAGIGLTPSSSYSLRVSGSGNIRFDDPIYSYQNMYHYAAMYIGGSGTTGYLYVRDSGSNNKFYVSGATGEGRFAGSVKIGAYAAPVYPLDVSGQAWITTQLGVGATPHTAYSIRTSSSIMCRTAVPAWVYFGNTSARIGIADTAGGPDVDIYHALDVHGPCSIAGNCSATGIFIAGGFSGQTGAGLSFITALQWSGATLQKKTRSLDFRGGIITAIGAESGWVNV